MIRVKENSYKLNIKVIPNANQTMIKSVSEDEIIMEVNAQPENNKANIEIIKYFSRSLKINKEDVFIVDGMKSKHKTILINNLTDTKKLDNMFLKK